MLRAVITTFLRHLKACVQGSKNFRRIYKLPQHFRRQNGDMHTDDMEILGDILQNSVARVT